MYNKGKKADTISKRSDFVTKRYSIGILICVILICGMYWLGYQFVKEQPQLQIEESAEEIPTRTVAGTTDEKVYKYYLVEEDGYVSVYLDDRVTLYETTSISVRLLPESIQEEIKKGKALEDEHDLYNFLENYSS